MKIFFPLLVTIASVMGGATSFGIAHAQTSAQQKAVQTRQANALRLVAAARTQIGDLYDQSYFSLSYPNGDVPRGRGACTDVVVRSLRSIGFDLQRLIHEDKRRFPAAYPRKNQHAKLDKNIDHRRVVNQVVFFARYGQKLTTQTTATTRSHWRAGDIVVWKFDNGLDHIGIISDKTNSNGWPLVIHNIGGCAENNVLNKWRIVGHYRFPK
jgi:uncharacterized protein YijF (DUF1287 family)